MTNPAPICGLCGATYVWPDRGMCGPCRDRSGRRQTAQAFQSGWEHGAVVINWHGIVVPADDDNVICQAGIYIDDADEYKDYFGSRYAVEDSVAEQLVSEALKRGELDGLFDDRRIDNYKE